MTFIGDRPALRALNASQDEADTSRPFASRLDLFQTPAALSFVAADDGDRPSARSEPLGQIVNARRDAADYTTPRLIAF